MANPAPTAVLSLLLLLVILSPETRKLRFCEGASTFDCRKDEREALLRFKDDVDDPFGMLSSWVGRNCCSWSGVTCSDITGRVVRLDLHNPKDEPYEGLVGHEISPSLLALQELTYLSLKDNLFQGADVPKFIGSFKSLEYLDLSNSYLTGPFPPELGNLSSLRYLDLSGSLVYDQPKLRIEDDSWLSRFSSLQYLALEDIDVKNASSALESLSTLPLLSELSLSGSITYLPRALPRQVNYFPSLSILDLSFNSLDTDIPEWPFEIGTLKHLDLSYNKFVGRFPMTNSNLTSLEVLDMSHNKFIQHGTLAAATGVAKLSNLRNLAWSASDLRGPLPLWLGDLKKLQTLDLSENSLSGSIPSYPLSALENLHLSQNQLNGTLLESLGQLSSLVMLDLSRNSLDDVITEAHFKNLTSLRNLDLSENPMLRFDIRPEWTPPPQLIEAVLSNCKIGPVFPPWLRNINNISLIAMSNAGISDRLPDWFYNFSSNVEYVDLSNNMIKGNLPANSLRHLNVGYLDLSNNQLEGSFPQFSAKTGRLSLANNSISGPLPPNIGELMPNASYLSFSANKLSGNIPYSICNMKALTFLDLSENKFSGEIPNCLGAAVPNLIANKVTPVCSSHYLEHPSSEKPISGEIQNCVNATATSKLEVVALSKNNLSGSIPASICSSRYLSYLLLEENGFIGELPPCLANCTSLEILDLGHNSFNGSIPTWIGDNLTQMEILNLGSNMFTGRIPTNLGSLGALNFIDLSHNMLSGPIPQSFANMNSMKYSHGQEINEWYDAYTNDLLNSGRYIGKLFNMEVYEGKMDTVTKGRVVEYEELLVMIVSMDLSNNNLSGEIPQGLTTLAGLQNLNLSRNHLTGTIPRNVTGLKSLESLDLSFNNLSGEIPSSMASLSFLAVMNFSFNNFSGRIPTGGQFENHPYPSIYIGNVNLCGFPLNSCGGSVTSHPQQMINNEDAGNKEEVWFYLSMALGFIFGFWISLGTLLLKSKWRIAYYRYIDSIYDKIYVFVAITMAKPTGNAKN